MLTGTKVGLRAIEETDLTQLRNWRNRPEFRRNFREHRELGLANQKAWFDKVAVSSNDFMFMIVDLANSEEPIGACGLLYTSWIIRSADFSFYIGKSGAYIDDEGYAEEAAQLLINYGFQDLNLNKVWMELYEFDHRKLSFFREQFGFTTDGQLPQNCFSEGKYWDSFLISLLATNWAGASPPADIESRTKDAS